MTEVAERFRALHVPGRPLLMPNPWDAGSAKLLASLGFEALATTSSGFAATFGRLDGGVTREEAIAHSAELVQAVDVPVSADLENGFGDSPEEVAETVRRAVGAGLAGCSIEDFGSGRLYEPQLAADRVAAAVAAGGGEIVLTARAENHIRGNPDLDDTIRRLQAYAEAGADVLFAPGLSEIADIRRVVEAVDLPVNVLALAKAPSVAELAAAGVARISVGGAFTYVALGAVAQAAQELREGGTYGYWDLAAVGAKAARAAFGSA
jgi:2-methylisocitrate lyase-like PEP mutase family enzyme